MDDRIAVSERVALSERVAAMASSVGLALLVEGEGERAVGILLAHRTRRFHEHCRCS